MSMKLTAMAMDLRVGNALRKLVLLKLCDNANDRGECFPSLQHIADQCEISRRSAINHINALVEMGFLVRKNRARDGEKISNWYVVDLTGKESISTSKKLAGGSAGNAPPSAGDALPPSAGDAHRTNHSFEPVNEPVKPQGNSQDSLRDAQGGDVDNSDLFAGTGQAELPPEKPAAKKSAKAGYPQWFETLWSQFPPRAGASDKRRALQAANARVGEGKTPDDLLAAVDRYAKFVRATGRWGSQYVMQAQTFFGPGGHVDNPWSVPHDFSRTNSPPRESLIERIERQAREVCADAEAGAHGGGSVDADDADFRAAMGGATGRC